MGKKQDKRLTLKLTIILLVLEILQIIIEMLAKLKGD